MGASGDRKTARRAAPSRSRVACALIAAALLPAIVQAANAPVAISAGSRDSVTTLGGRCPTFSWSRAAGAPGSELVIWPVDGDGEVSGPYRSIELRSKSRSVHGRPIRSG